MYETFQYLPVPLPEVHGNFGVRVFPYLDPAEYGFVLWETLAPVVCLDVSRAWRLGVGGRLEGIWGVACVPLEAQAGAVSLCVAPAGSPDLANRRLTCLGVTIRLPVTACVGDAVAAVRVQLGLDDDTGILPVLLNGGLYYRVLVGSVRWVEGVHVCAAYLDDGVLRRAP